MSFQKNVRKDMAFGVVGELQFSGPLRAGAYVLKSTAEANNVIGRAFTFVADSPGMVAAGGAAGTVFAGILANAKVYARRGSLVSAASDAELLTVPNGAVGEFVTMGFLTVAITNKAKVGDTIQYDPTTGILSASAKAGTADSYKVLVPNCTVARYAQTDTGGLVVIRLTN